ncbi:putative GPI-anchored protein pfl2 [Strigops habroptila]|uniref:putative GPI-anchored protein pfl2 n=1 Tax=Strigops habroptila TaxID=2489341 RepID=UPI001401D4C2|nr:putative GPI-anchored protein pfl2 [Strigops habroptila]
MPTKCEAGTPRKAALPAAASSCERRHRRRRSASSSSRKARKRQDTAATASTSQRVRLPAGSPGAAAAALPSSESSSATLSASTTVSVAVADSAGRPWSFTTTTKLCRAASRASGKRAVRTSPLCSPTRNSPGSVALASSYDSHAFCPASASTATTLATSAPGSAERGASSTPAQPAPAADDGAAAGGYSTCGALSFSSTISSRTDTLLLSAGAPPSSARTHSRTSRTSS